MNEGLQVQPVGVFCLGLFVGYVAWYFAVRMPRDKFSIDGLTAFVGVFAGGAVVKLLEDYLSKDADAWWYPIGLLAGFLLYVLFRVANKLVGDGGDGDDPVFPTSLGLFKASGPSRVRAPAAKALADRSAGAGASAPQK